MYFNKRILPEKSLANCIRNFSPQGASLALYGNNAICECYWPLL